MISAAPTDYSNMSASQIASSVANDPNIAAATNNYNTQSGNYQQAVDEGGSLPTLLSRALSQGVNSPDNPTQKSLNTDTQALLTAMQNPSHAIAEASQNGAILSPEQQNEAMAERFSGLSGAVNMDTLGLNAQNAGVGNTIDAFSKAIAGKTQALLAAVKQAQDNRDFLWNKAQSLGQMAMQANQIGFEQAHDPMAANQAAMADLAKAIKSGESWQDIKSKFLFDARLKGITMSQLYKQYQDAGGRDQPSAADYQYDQQFNSGNPQARGEADIMSTLGHLEGRAQGLGQLIQGTGQTVAPWALNELLKSQAGRTATGLTTMGEEGLSGIGGLLSLLF